MRQRDCSPSAANQSSGFTWAVRVNGTRGSCTQRGSWCASMAANRSPRTVVRGEPTSCRGGPATRRAVGALPAAARGATQDGGVRPLDAGAHTDLQPAGAEPVECHEFLGKGHRMAGIRRRYLSSKTYSLGAYGSGGEQGHAAVPGPVLQLGARSGGRRSTVRRPARSTSRTSAKNSWQW